MRRNHHLSNSPLLRTGAPADSGVLGRSIFRADAAFQVFLSGAGHEHYVGTLRVMRKEAPDTPWQRCTFQFTERKSEWILRDEPLSTCSHQTQKALFSPSRIAHLCSPCREREFAP